MYNICTLLISKLDLDGDACLIKDCENHKKVYRAVCSDHFKHLNVSFII